MFQAPRTQFRAIPFPRGLQFFRRDVVPTRVTSASARNYTAYALNNRQIPRYKWTRRILWGLLFGSLGFYNTKSLVNALLHPAEPGSKEDVTQLARLRKIVDRLPRVQKLRLDPMYDEWDAYEGVKDADKERRLTSGPLKGSRALAVQRIFWNDSKKVCVNIVRFGESTDGWPSVVHGGAMATVLDETLGRVAIQSVPAHTGVTAHLEISYQRPVHSREFYTVVATLDKERSTDRKSYVKAVVIDQKGNIHCTAGALFVVPKNVPLRPLVERF